MKNKPRVNAIISSVRQPRLILLCRKYPRPFNKTRKFYAIPPIHDVGKYLWTVSYCVYTSTALQQTKMDRPRYSIIPMELQWRAFRYIIMYERGIFRTSNKSCLLSLNIFSDWPWIDVAKFSHFRAHSHETIIHFSHRRMCKYLKERKQNHLFFFDGWTASLMLKYCYYTLTSSVIKPRSSC